MALAADTGNPHIRMAHLLCLNRWNTCVRRTPLSFQLTHDSCEAHFWKAFRLDWTLCRTPVVLHRSYR